ncbi:SIS domain-containing protein [Tepidibacillus fermentans]|uniref:Galactosamine 6-phosphate isomerase AgaS n=1 Tax=Tepidibacillus fermentans TaxID=1281767 RepID=A0A4R3KEP6_9BACI|nr:SIS domain-containing protein [Tepidibacillus fermentans]TCS81826.1 galactosamine 6-phosphate isomerase AgaS [Tepidibacillus fermentans]
MEKFFGYDEEYLKKITGYITAKEIRQQPRLWKETLDIVKRNKDSIDSFLNHILKKDKIRIIFTGAGTSAFVGESVVPYLNKKYPGKFESIATTDIVTNPENYLFSAIPTLLISFARSGNSPESIATVDLAKQIVNEVYQIVITCNPEGSLAKKTQNDPNSLLLLMPEDSNDQGFAMTGSFSSMTLAALLLFENLEEIEQEIKLIIGNGEKILDKMAPLIKDLAENDFERIIYLGSSSLKGLATESALKTLELTNGELIATYESSLGLRHGPKTMINNQTLIVSYISNNAYTRKYEIDLLKELASEKNYHKLIAVSSDKNEEIESLVDNYFYISDQGKVYKDDVYLIFNYVLIAQMFSFFKSIQLGHTPDNPCPDGSVNRVVKGVIIHPYNK